MTFPILDADGDLVTGAAALDSEVSIDAGTFADCTNEATEIATSSGMYYLDLTAAEMNGDTIAIIVKTTTVGAKTTPIVLYPEEAGDYRVDVVQWLGTAAATPTVAGVPEVDVTHWLGTAAATPTTAGVPEVDVTFVAGTAQTARDLGAALPAAAPGASGGLVRVGANSAAVSFTAGMTISSTTGNALSLSSSGGNGHGLAAAGNGSGDGISAIGGGTGHGMQLIGGVTSGDGLHVHGMGTGHGILAEAHGTGAGISAAITGNITGNLSGSVGSVTGAVGSVTGAVGSVTGLTASDVGAIKAKTDSLTFTVANQVDANIQSINDVTLTGNGQVGTEFSV